MADQENASEIFHYIIYFSKWKQEIFVFVSENFLLFYYFLFNIRTISLCLGDYKHFLPTEVSQNLRRV